MKKSKVISIAIFFILASCQWPSGNSKNKEIDKILDRGFKSDSLEDYYGSIKIYDSVLKIDPDNIAALVNRGRAKISTGDTLAGLADLDASIKIQPTPEAYLSKAIARMNSNPHEGLNYLETGKQLFPGEIRMTSSLAGYYSDIYPIKDSALYYADYTMNHHVKYPFFFFGPMDAYLEFKDYPNLIRVTDSIITHFPEDAYPYNNRGLARLNLGDVSAAKKDIVTSLGLDSNNAWAYRNMGLLFEKMNRADSSCFYLKRARQKDTANKYKRDIDSLILIFCKKK